MMTENKAWFMGMVAAGLMLVLVAIGWYRTTTEALSLPSGPGVVQTWDNGGVLPPKDALPTTPIPTMKHIFMMPRLEGINQLDVFAIVTFETNVLCSDRDAWDLFKEGVNDWVHKSAEGKAAWLESSQDLNIGDMDVHIGSPELKMYLGERGITEFDFDSHANADTRPFDEILATIPGESVLTP